eukprot:TRINITY_DN10491_c0_g1_i1.p1 TRINITY_DN10491_c0_g1~~TRINITY_DN10491_c0_g1_i1.p1  ORF type:complete len:284 (-),score=105.34 TRINITY_DN10491_c0_g1_i1:19-870(-)
MEGDEEIIELNIGGVLYTTTRGTLLNQGKSSFFSGLLSGNFKQNRDKRGALFIDRDGQYFAPILEYLRTGYVNIPKGIPIECVAREATFYSIDIPSLYLHELEEKQELASVVGGGEINMFITDSFLQKRQRVQAYEKISDTADGILNVVLRQFREKSERGNRIESGCLVRPRTASDSQLVQLLKTIDANEGRNNEWVGFRESYVNNVKSRLDNVYSAPDTVVDIDWITFLTIEKNQQTICNFCQSNGLTLGIEKVEIQGFFNYSIYIGFKFIHCPPTGGKIKD